MNSLQNEIFIASDHAGFELKKYILNMSLNVIDLGAYSADPVDYTDFASKLCHVLKNNAVAIGVLICASGIGMSMAANRYSHIRAALCYNKEIAILSRQHNNANVLVLGARFITQQESATFLNSFLTTKFEGGRHQRRVDKLGLI